MLNLFPGVPSFSLTSDMKPEWYTACVTIFQTFCVRFRPLFCVWLNFNFFYNICKFRPQLMPSGHAGILSQPIRAICRRITTRTRPKSLLLLSLDREGVSVEFNFQLISNLTSRNLVVIQHDLTRLAMWLGISRVFSNQITRNPDLGWHLRRLNRLQPSLKFTWFVREFTWIVMWIYGEPALGNP